LLGLIIMDILLVLAVAKEDIGTVIELPPVLLIVIAGARQGSEDRLGSLDRTVRAFELSVLAPKETYLSPREGVAYDQRQGKEGVRLPTTSRTTIPQ